MNLVSLRSLFCHVPLILLGLGSDAITVAPRVIGSYSVKDLIELAETTQDEFIFDGIMSMGDIFLLHGFEETFKSVLVIDAAARIAAGEPFLGWTVSKARRAGVIETEIHPVQMGKRLARMFSGAESPANLRFMDKDTLKKLKRAKSIESKFQVVSDWVKSESLEVLLIDTCNDFFRGKDDPAAETAAGEFFDRLRELQVAVIGVRHDRKSHADAPDAPNVNDAIRGSGEWKEDPEVIFHVERSDKRMNQVTLRCGKMRYGPKPEDMSLWADTDSFRVLKTDNPVATILERGPKLRSEIIDEAARRFGLSERKADELLSKLKSQIQQEQAGHAKRFVLRPLQAA
jgi:RecA-family ATPase